jgi:riboflavin synthase
MFSGLIAYRGTIESAQPFSGGGATLRVRAPGVAEERPEPKDSVAVNGVCLTVTRVDGDVLEFDVIPETLLRSNLGALHAGDDVNLEYSLRLGDRIGGHFVYGHVDATGEVLARNADGQGERMRVSVPANLEAMVCEKAFVSVDGVSLTVASAGPGYFELALIPETLARTTLGRRGVGDRVNIEADPLARYAAAALQARSLSESRT